MKFGRVFSFIFTMALISAGVVVGQVSDTAAIQVQANNNGIFVFDITSVSTTFNFGTVDADGVLLPGTTAGVVALGRNVTDNGGRYERTGAFTWEVRSAPVRSGVDIYISTVTPAATNTMASDQVELRVPATMGGTTAGYKNGASLGAVAGLLLDNMANVGNGGNSATGSIDLRLTVDDTDAVGANQWDIVLTAAAP